VGTGVAGRGLCLDPCQGIFECGLVEVSLRLRRRRAMRGGTMEIGLGGKEEEEAAFEHARQQHQL